jgi:hypothetical protein
MLAGWISRQQQVVIDYLRMENQVLRETHGKKITTARPQTDSTELR